MQPVTGYASRAGDSITALAEQHGVSRESLLEFVRSKVQQTQQDGEPAPGDDAAASTADESSPLGYTSSARSVPARPASSPSISVLA